MKIKVKVGRKKLFIVDDKHGFTIGEDKLVANRKTKEKSIQFVGMYYFHSLSNALRYLFEMQVGASDAKTVHELLAVIEEVRADINKIFSL